MIGILILLSIGVGIYFAIDVESIFGGIAVGTMLIALVFVVFLLGVILVQEDAKAKAPIEYIKTVDTYTYEVEIDSSEIAKGLLIEEAGGKVLFVKSLRKAVVLDGFFFWPFTYTIDAKFLWSVKPYKTVEVDR